MNEIIDKIIIDSLNEDMPNGDVTTDNLIPDNHKSEGKFIAKENGVLSGLDVAKRVFEIVGGDIELTLYKNNGDTVQVGDLIGLIKGDTKTILKGERVALNIMQRMSGVATLTNRFVSEITNTKTKIYDTRKTTPNLRILEKLAVTHGGGVNHRYSLSDQVMIKDNHIRAVGSIKKALELAHKKVSKDIKIEIEVESLEQLKEALQYNPDIIMLDNMSNELMKEAVEITNGRALLEASGNMSAERIKSVSETGVDIISVGALTHSYKSLDISLKF